MCQPKRRANLIKIVSGHVTTLPHHNMSTIYNQEKGSLIHPVGSNYTSHFLSISSSSLSSVTTLTPSATTAVSTSSCSTITSSSSSSSQSAPASSSILKFSKSNFHYCFRLHHKYGSLVRSYVPPYCTGRLLLIVLGFVVILCLYWLSVGYVKSLLLWIETQNEWFIFALFICFFTIVSFPVVVGYLILIITSGYLFGLARGLATVLIGANVGAAFAQWSIQKMQSKLPIQRLIKNETGKAILRVISGPRSFKVVLLARLTPIPFGIQNTIFGVSNVHRKSYYLATLIGLFPAQLINVYIGSSLRSMQDVLHNHNSAVASYAVFAIQICIGLVLMSWVVHKAKQELADHLLLDIDDDFNVIVEVQA